MSGTVIDVVTRPGLTLHPDVNWIREHLQAAAALLPRPIKRLHVTIAADEWMAELNRRHLKVEGTTDVLSFPDEEESDAVAAEVVICADEAARQGEQRGHSWERELLLYALHGLLHCAGYDDEDPADFAAMHAEEDRLLEAVGVGRTFGVRAGQEKAGPEAGP